MHVFIVDFNITDTDTFTSVHRRRQQKSSDAYIYQPIAGIFQKHVLYPCNYLEYKHLRESTKG